MKTLLENSLTRLPMYFVTGGSLMLLVFAAIGMALLGELSFSPFAIIVSSAVMIGVSILASFVLGKLYGVPSHVRSAAITGSILALIFSPTVDVNLLTQYALIAVIAAASKYVITYNHRHIFNPAAFGAFLGGVVGLQYASWWVANPSLAVLIILLSVVTLYKTRLLTFGLLFVAVAMGILLLRGIEIRTLITSWPIIFMAGFMLSEPLTLPPLRLQRYAEAILVAVLVALPFKVFGLHSSPELALLVGNIFAFIVAFKYRKSYRLTFAARKRLTPTVDEYTFKTDKPVYYQPGQYIELTLPHKHQDFRGTRRFFSVVRADASSVTVAVKFFEKGSSFKQHLRMLKPGAVLFASNLSGEFTLPKDPEKKVLLVAGGIGVTPFVSYLPDLPSRDVVLLYFAASSKEHAYKNELLKAGIDVRFITGTITESALQIPELFERYAQVSGSPAMVSYVTALLKNKTAGIKTDYFSGY